MSEDIPALLNRIADALERLAPPPAQGADFGRARLFRFAPAPAQGAADGFMPAPDYALALDLLVGVERQKTQFVENLTRFAEGLPSNHALLWGARGAGKSSLAKAAFMAVGGPRTPLRMVEIDRDDIAALPRLFEDLRGRAERFAVLCDDLSFEEGAAAAKSLKSALEGGVAGPPGNVMFVATSNRRHLMPRHHDERGDPMASAEDAEEEVSVSDRFGLWIGFPPMDQDAFLAAVRAYAARFDLMIPDLDRRALQWSQLRGARSGRVAWQFVRDLAGELGKPLPL